MGGGGFRNFWLWVLAILPRAAFFHSVRYKVTQSTSGFQLEPQFWGVSKTLLEHLTQETRWKLPNELDGACEILQLQPSSGQAGRLRQVPVPLRGPMGTIGCETL